MNAFDPGDLARAIVTPRWAALSQLDAVAADLHNFDAGLLRAPRLLVPVDVQALVVRAGVNDGEPMVTLPFRAGVDEPPAALFDKGAPRAPGVHLLWSVPAALGRGRVVDDPAAPDDATRRRLQLPALPDRWVVLRLAVATGAVVPSVTGWVLAADTGTVTPLADWPGGTPTTAGDPGTAMSPDRLDVHVGGNAWTRCYDAAYGRLALHDPLSDLVGVQLEGDSVSYLVAGWWSHTELDPLDAVGTDAGYRSTLADLGWDDPDHPSPDVTRRNADTVRQRAPRMFGLDEASRFTQAVERADPNLKAAKVSGPTTVSGFVAAGAMRVTPTISSFLEAAKAAAALPPAPTRSTLLTGRLHGVPVAAALTPEARPDGATIRLALGSSTPDVAAVLSVQGTAISTTDTRRDAERLLAAFASNAILRLGDSDAWSDIEEWEHAHGYGSLPGGFEAVDRFVDRPGSANDPGTGFRAGGADTAAAPHDAAAVTDHTAVSVLWNPVRRPGDARLSVPAAATRASFDAGARALTPDRPATTREVTRPAPRFQFPAAPVLAVSGGGRALSAVEREEASGALVCRFVDQVSQGHAGVLPAQSLLTTIGSAAVPPELLDLAREALAEDPYLADWRAGRAATNGLDADAARLRMHAESALSYSYYAADDDFLTKLTATSITSAPQRQRAVEALQRFSTSQAVWAHPEGVTLWGQPWRPMFCEWQLELDLGGLDGWELGGIDLNPADATQPTARRAFTGRSALVTGVATSLSASITTWLTQERQRDTGGHALADAATERALSSLCDALGRLDLMSVALDGIREQLLGLSYDRGLLHTGDDPATRQALAVAAPILLAAGRLRVTAARLVDAFGRVLDLPVDALLVAGRLTDPAQGDEATMLVPPRLTAPARWRFDLVDATTMDVTAAIARIDQADLTKQVNPVAGFLLPDHMDESLEVFAGDGTPLGELLHDPFSDAVTWEIAPGRTDVAPAAGPSEDTNAAHARVGWIAAGLVAADATGRAGKVRVGESPLSAMLRAIDTTLWTVDPFGALGQAHIAGLVGRPIAVVAARLALDVQSDVTALTYGAGTDAAERERAYDSLVALPFEVRLGEITRTDDSLLGYFVEDDFAHFHVVDRVVAELALPSGRGRGTLSDDGPSDVPDPITHPYVDAAGVLQIRPGQAIRLTLLMHPGGKAHLTSGVLPRVEQALARDWVDPGLSVLAPSLRTGPLLIDADKVRLPKIASFPAEQLFTRRDTPTTWKDDPILAATQSALLPDQQPTLQEGWVRVAPTPKGAGS